VQTNRLLIAIGATTVVVSMGSVLDAPSASGDCSNSNGVTVCAQGEVRGGGGGTGPTGSSGPYYPYPCEDDYLCDDGGVSIVLNPGRPDIGYPGRPGGPGGGGGGRSGGRR
jgi:hypothetical protein